MRRAASTKTSIAPRAGEEPERGGGTGGAPDEGVESWFTTVVRRLSLEPSKKDLSSCSVGRVPRL